MLLVHVSRLQEFADCVGYLIEEGLRGDRDVVAGDDRGLAGRGQQDRRSVLRGKQMSGGADGLHDGDTSVCFGVAGLADRRSQRVVVSGCRRNDAAGDEVVEVVGKRDLLRRQFAVAIGDRLEDGDGRGMAVGLADEKARGFGRGETERLGVGGQGGGRGDQGGRR
ncbi:hypothetical protein [Micromonospora sp. S4605]|uniref:hypothetical protein n=1 Tax=Micromonospora sp. S4605 TaxID=1420897 RepID=UPI0011B6A29A|nr:hypothetical protein [Micromonospora sp. S4605]